MKNTLKWRLSKLPTVDEITTLLDKKIITQEEAKEILFNNETQEEAEKSSLEKEIEFLRKVVENLSDSETVKTTVTQYLPSYITQPFYQPYYYWSNPNVIYCNSLTGSSSTLATYTVSDGSTTSTSTAGGNYGTSGTSSSFCDIKTF